MAVLTPGAIIADAKLTYLGGSAKKNPDGSFTRLHDFQVLRCDVAPLAPVNAAADPQFTSVVNGLVEDCVFHDWLDAYYSNPTAPGAINHHIEDFQIGGCQGFVIRRCKFLNGETHALFCRAWSASSSVPPQAVQGLHLEENVFGPTRHGFNAVDLMDDLVDPKLGPSDAKILGNAFGQSLSCRISKGPVEIAYNHFPAMTQYQLGLWKSAGYNVHDNVYQSIDKGTSPFPGDKVDSKVDLTVAPGVPGTVTPPTPPPPVPTPPPPPAPVPPPPVDPRDAQIAALQAKIDKAKADLA